jgi:hypothetical protein
LTPLKFKIPYYAQSSEFTCGPACVLMTFKHFDPDMKLSRTLEFEVWRQCNMIGVKGADPYGLSVPLMDRGYEVHLLTQSRRMIDTALWRQRPRVNPFTPEEMSLTIFGIAENRKRALRRGLSLEHRRPMVERIAERVGEGFVPIALVHMGIVHRLDTPHWVVVVDVGEDQVTFNDPYPPKGRKNIRLGRPEFQKMVDDIGNRIGLSPSVIFVRKRPMPAGGFI